MTRTILGTMLLGTMLAAAVAACSSTPQPIPLSTAQADIQALEGEWIGEYHSYDETDRSGTLLFRLEAGQDTVRGDVLMHLAGRETAAVIPFTTDPWANVAQDQLLTVTFVRAAGGTVFGELDVYHDPLCGCEIRTTFTGRVAGNLLEGSYTSVHVNGADEMVGAWRVVRSFPDD